MTLLQGEEKITEASNGLIVLTNKRIRMRSHHSGQELVSILLCNVSSVFAIYRSRPILLLLGGCVFLGGVFVAVEAEPSAGMFLFLIALVLIAIYFMSRKHVIQIASKGGRSIDFHISGMSDAMVQEFIHKLESAMDKTSFSYKN